MTPQRPLLSIIIPTYKRSTHLPLLLSALTSQSLTNIEILIVDQNPSPTPSPHASTDSRVNHFRLDIQNASLARNIGYSRSQGKYLLFIDDDLLPCEDFCARALETFISFSSVRCLCPKLFSHPGGGGATIVINNYHRAGNKLATHLSEIKDPMSAAVFFERNYFKYSGGFDPNLFDFARTGEDQELFLRMESRGLSVWLDESLLIYHDESAPGGCDLRTTSYWNTRERCIKSWVFRHRVHNGSDLSLKANNIVALLRSTILNRDLFRRGISAANRDLQLLHAAIKSSRDFLSDKTTSYRNPQAIDHLTGRMYTNSFIVGTV